MSHTKHMLRSRADVPRDVAVLAHWPGQYVAVSTPKWALPQIPWTVFRAQVDPTVSSDSLYVGIPDLGNGIPVMYRPVDPVTLTQVILSAPSDIFESLKTKKESLKQHLPELLRQGDFIESLGCRVRACEPADQGLIDREKTSVSVVIEDFESIDPSVSFASISFNEPSLDVEISHFLLKSEEQIELTVSILQQPILAQSVVPAPEIHEDMENAVFLKVDQMAGLGVFSGDLIKITAVGSGSIPDSNRSRIVRVFAYPEPNSVSSDLFVPPLLSYNLGGPNTVKVSVATEKEPFAIPVAKDVTISRVASPISTDRSYQQAFLSGLRSYFESSYRVVKNNDIIGVLIDTTLAQALFSTSPANGEDEIALTGNPDAVVWFKVSALSSGDQCIIKPAHTRMVQSGVVQQKCVPSSFHWEKYYSVPSLPPFPSSGPDFKYAQEVRRLLRSSLTARGASLNTTILMTSSKRGAGKTTVLRSVAAELGIHEMTIDCYSVIGDSDTKTVGTVKARLDRASHIGPCLVVLSHLDAIAKRSDQDGKDPTIIANLLEALDEYTPKASLILAATSNEPDKLSDSIRNRFKFEVEVTVPTENERRLIFKHLTNTVLPPTQLITDARSAQALQGFALQSNIPLSSLAVQSAGLIPPDLISIIAVAKQNARNRVGNNTDLILCQRGIVKITYADVEKAISDARSQYSDSIGAPKIPNVGWKDVGGLENVKSEIMDTIDMPLRYPQLFASGVKKRSGILFYGPPGTGKTLLAKAIATSFSLNFFSVKGPELLNMYIGESEANVRRVFQKARDAKPCVVFFDELDSVAPKRGNQGDSGGVMDRIVSQLLAELDGMSQGSDGVFVIGATNRPDLLDEALLRPGRFDKMLYLGVSDTHEKQRTILEALTRKFDLGPDIDLASIANNCPFTFTGADFYALSSDAMLNAMTRTANNVDGKIAEYNKQRVANGQTPTTIRSWFEHVARPEDIKVLVAAEDFDKAQKELVPSVSADELAHYLRVRGTFEGKAATPQSNGNSSSNEAPNGSMPEINAA